MKSLQNEKVQQALLFCVLALPQLPTTLTRLYKTKEYYHFYNHIFKPTVEMIKLKEELAKTQTESERCWNWVSAEILDMIFLF